MRLACAVARRRPRPVTRRRRRLRFRPGDVGCSPRRFSWPSREPRSTGFSNGSSAPTRHWSSSAVRRRMPSVAATPRRRGSSRNGWRARRQTKSGSRRRPRVGQRARAPKPRRLGRQPRPRSRVGRVWSCAGPAARNRGGGSAAGRREGWGCSAGERCVRAGAERRANRRGRRGKRGRQAHPLSLAGRIGRGPLRSRSTGAIQRQRDRGAPGRLIVGSDYPPAGKSGPEPVEP